jgi:hypothetical protein
MTIVSLPKRAHYSNGSFCDPKTEYYFVSYHVISSIKWVRMPFLTMAEVKDTLESLPYLLTPGMVPSNKRNLPGILPDYKNLQVYSESWLSQLHQDWDDTSQQYVNSEVTNRQVIFDNRYESAAVYFTGVPSLSRQKGEDKDAWRQRVEQQRSALKDQSTARMHLHQKLVEHQGDLPALFALRLEGMNELIG